MGASISEMRGFSDAINCRLHFTLVLNYTMPLACLSAFSGEQSPVVACVALKTQILWKSNWFDQRWPPKCDGR